MYIYTCIHIYIYSIYANQKAYHVSTGKYSIYTTQYLLSSWREVCCSVLQCVAVSCSELQRVAMWIHMTNILHILRNTFSPALTGTVTNRYMYTKISVYIHIHICTNTMYKLMNALHIITIIITGNINISLFLQNIVSFIGLFSKRDL